jgi:hypothetical protein
MLRQGVLARQSAAGAHACQSTRSRNLARQVTHTDLLFRLHPLLIFVRQDLQKSREQRGGAGIYACGKQAWNLPSSRLRPVRSRRRSALGGRTAIYGATRTFQKPLPCAIGPGFPARNVRVTSAATLLRGKRKYVNGVIPAPEARNELAQSEASACEAVRLGKAGIIMKPRRGGTTTALQEHRT